MDVPSFTVAGCCCWSGVKALQIAGIFVLVLPRLGREDKPCIARAQHHWDNHEAMLFVGD